MKAIITNCSHRVVGRIFTLLSLHILLFNGVIKTKEILLVEYLKGDLKRVLITGWAQAALGAHT